MRRTALLVPLGSFALAVLISTFSAPASRPILRAQAEPTGAATFCAKWELTKHTSEAANWTIKINNLPSVMTGAGRKLGVVGIHTVVRARLTGHLRGSPRVVFGGDVQPYAVFLESRSFVRDGDPANIPLHPRSFPKNVIEAQIKAQFRSSQGSLLEPILAENVLVDTIHLLDQDLTIQTDGVILCLRRWFTFGQFIPRPVTFTVTSGNGSGTN